MKKKIEGLFEEIKSYKADHQDDIEKFRLRFLSRKGAIQNLFGEFKNVANEEKKEMGKLLNDLKTHAQEHFNKLQDSKNVDDSAAKSEGDLSLPVDFSMPGSRHPL